MAVYVDDVRHQFGRMIMCHLWADTEAELDEFALALGLNPEWRQQPPKASWVHYDISLGMKKKALAMGARLTDKYGPAEHVARLRGNTRMVETIAQLRNEWRKSEKAAQLAIMYGANPDKEI